MNRDIDATVCWCAPYGVLKIKMTQPSEFIDVEKLENELVNALEADRKYSRENDAKFRAVHQRVATYEEFR